MRSLWAVVVVGLGLAGNAGASRYEIPLAELKGVYSSMGDIAPCEKYVSFAFPVSFQRIDSVSLAIAGNAAPARFRVDDTEPPAYLDRYSPFVFRLTPTGDQFITCAVAIWTPSGPAESEVEFAKIASLGDTAWGPFLGGQGELCLGVLQPQDSPHWPSGEWIVPDIEGISDARLIVEGVAVPEPASVLVVVPALVLLARRRRKVD